MTPMWQEIFSSCQDLSYLKRNGMRADRQVYPALVPQSSSGGDISFIPSEAAQESSKENGSLDGCWPCILCEGFQFAQPKDVILFKTPFMSNPAQKFHICGKKQSNQQLFLPSLIPTDILSLIRRSYCNSTVFQMSYFMELLMLIMNYEIHFLLK